MLSLTDFISRLPNVLPRKARTVILGGDLLNEEQLRDIFYRSAHMLDMVQVVGPVAAKAILMVYEEGKLPMKKGAKVSDAPLARAYADDPALLAQMEERRRRKDCVKDTSLVRESDFHDNRLLDSIFWQAMGAGEGTLNLAGIDVTKNIRGFRTNSGKNTDYEVSFSWVGSDGVRKQTGTGLPPAAFNRRNDEERDYGLYE